MEICDDLTMKSPPEAHVLSTGSPASSNFLGGILETLGGEVCWRKLIPVGKSLMIILLLGPFFTLCFLSTRKR